MCKSAGVGMNMPLKKISPLRWSSEKRRFSAISQRIPDVLDCSARGGYHGIQAAINNIGVPMPDITPNHAGHPPCDTCRCHCFSCGFAD
jgi:hypothetical protein